MVKPLESNINARDIISVNEFVYTITIESKLSWSLNLYCLIPPLFQLDQKVNL